MKWIWMIAIILAVVPLLAGQFGMSGAGNSGGINHDASGPFPENAQQAIFAGGCFWCMQPPFDKLDGVLATWAGYTGGTEKDPTYEQVSAGATGHAEAIQVIYDPTRISYEKLLDVFWHNIDPTTPNRQFADAGTQYRSAVFYNDENQKRLAEASRDRLAASGKFGDRKIVTEISPAGPFYKAEEYHQKYYKKNPFRYKAYRQGSGREGYLEKTWGKPE